MCRMVEYATGHIDCIGPVDFKRNREAWASADLSSDVFSQQVANRDPLQVLVV